MIELLKKHFLIKHTGELDNEGSKVRFLGRCLKRVGDSIVFYMDENYLLQELKDGLLDRCKPSSTTGTQDVKRSQGGE